MIDTLNLLIGPILMILSGLLLVGLFKRIAGETAENKRTGTKLMLWGIGGTLLLIAIVAVTNTFIAPSPVSDLEGLPTPTIPGN